MTQETIHRSMAILTTVHVSSPLHRNLATIITRTEVHMKLVWTVAFLLVSPLSVGIAYADSDGYYCAGGDDRQ